MTIIASNVTPLIFQSTLDAVTLLNLIFMRTSYMYVASPDALMQIFPLIIKNFFRKHGCLFFLRACVSGVPLILIHL